MVAITGYHAPPRTAQQAARPQALARWLLAVAALVVAIVVVGGITRLTESGLSITEWKPVTGALPPLSEAQWQAEFARYRQIPEYIEINGPAGMTLADYKAIYFWEWLHRLLARAIGLAFALPLAWFWWRRAIPAGYKPRLLALLALGGLQGAVGWWMVTSGLSVRTDVSHHRLAVHLLTALLTLGGLVWTALDLRALARDHRAGPARLRPLPAAALAVLALQLLLGAWMAGLDAGYVASDWPLMQGRLWPEGIDWTAGPLHAAANDPFLVHVLHRWWAWAVVAVLVVLARKVRRAGCRPASLAIHAAFGTQIILGIATVMSGMALWLAVLHQLTGALLVVATVWGAHALGAAMSGAALIWCPFPDEDSAAAAAEALLDEGLIACANLLPAVRSLYRWRGERGEAREVAALLKTTAARLAEAIARLAELHPYEAPAIAGWRCDEAAPATLAWLGELGEEPSPPPR